MELPQYIRADALEDGLLSPNETLNIRISELSDRADMGDHCVTLGPAKFGQQSEIIRFFQ
jgi:hypothetical protein